MADAAPLRISCPACGLAREFPAERAPGTLPHHCPRCGADVVAEGLLVAAADALPAPAAGEAPIPDVAPALGDAAGPQPHFPPTPTWEAAVLVPFAALLAWSHASHGFLAASLAGADLVFHEAGHPIFGLLGSRFLMFLGGTLGQLAFPIVAAVGFARARRAVPFAVALLWIGFNLVEIGTYAADASARVLPLLAVDEDSHDWWNLLGMLGLRDHCAGIGGAFRVAGWALWLGAPAWAAWRAVHARWIARVA
ncbi:MAG TPA: hypothetical protein VLT61_04165 [Anaeromyxobacteraceae bacterium]|nr:hypothetical protein [Anaeromyxobacteraceae bacterium]